MATDIEYRIAKWLQSLRDVTVPGTDPITPERIVTTAALLAKDGFPSGAFTSDSLHAAAQGQRFFPAYDDIRKALHAWWDANRPASAPQLAGPVVEGLNAMDRSWVAFWHKRRAEIFAQDISQQAAEAALDTVSSLVRSKSEKAWSAVSGERPAVPRAPTESEVSHVARLLRPEPVAGQPRYQVVKAPPPFRDVTAKGEELARIRGKTLERAAAVVSDREPWG